jgi:hypothetical protein
MDIKDLNKSQLILLAVLLSFITSIATGITTVTLMQQAPVAYTAPINRIIKQTVENIVQVPGTNTSQTVIVKEEDLVVDAIKKNKSFVFSITKDIQDAGGTKTETSIGQGFMVSSDGLIATDAAWVYGTDNYFVKNNSGKFKAEFLFVDKGVTFLKIGSPLDEKSVFSLVAPTFGDLSKTQAGQKIIVLGSTISSFIFDGSEDIKINVPKSVAGGLVFNLDGEVLGMAISGEALSFVPINTILASINTLQPKP